MRVIAVDDEEDALALISGAITICLPDAELKPFDNPVTALDYASKNPVDIAFLDITMPDMTGIDMAKKLKAINPKINIIFATGYSDYMADAFAMHASGYLLKPVGPKAVKKELENLRAPVGDTVPHVEIRTFGSFEIFVDGNPVSFSRKPAKEVLAFLVDRNGAIVSKKEMCTVLFNDPECTHQSMDYLAKIIKDLSTTLKSLGAGDVVNVTRTECSLNLDSFTCDAFEYQKGNPEAINKFYGEYMSQFEWAKPSVQKFYK